MVFTVVAACNFYRPSLGFFGDNLVVAFFSWPLLQRPWKLHMCFLFWIPTSYFNDFRQFGKTVSTQRPKGGSVPWKLRGHTFSPEEAREKSILEARKKHVQTWFCYQMLSLVLAIRGTKFWWPLALKARVLTSKPLYSKWPPLPPIK